MGEMKGSRMPTTLPSPADRGEFRFFAVDAEGVEWLWADSAMVWVKAEKEVGEVGEEAICATVN